LAARSLEIKVGMFVLLASLILILGVMWLQRFKLVEKKYDFYVRFPEVGGLTEDDPIMINGVEKGRVEGVYLRESGVLVDMGVNAEVRFPKDSRITLRSIGIMGERFVSIRSGQSDVMVEPGDTLAGVLEAGMSEVMGEAGKVLGELVETSSRLEEVLTAITGQGRLEESLDNLRAFSASLRRISEGDDSPLNSSIEHFERVTAQLDSLITKRYAAVDSSLQSFSEASARMRSAMDDLADVSADL